MSKRLKSRDVSFVLLRNVLISEMVRRHEVRKKELSPDDRSDVGFLGVEMSHSTSCYFKRSQLSW